MTQYEILILAVPGNILYSTIPENKLVMTVHDADSKTILSDIMYLNEIKQARYEKSGYAIRSQMIAKKKYLYFAQKVNNNIVSIAIPYRDVENHANKIENYIILFTAIGILLIFLMNYYIIRAVINPIKKISHFSKRFIENVSFRFSYQREDEIGELQLALNKVAIAIQRQLEETSFRKNEVETVIKNVSEGVLILDHKLRVILYNNDLYSILEIDPAVYHFQLEGKYYYEIIRNNNLNKLIEQSIEEKNRQTESIHFSKLEDKVLEVTCIPLPHDKGAVVLINNITEQYKLIQVKKSFVENVSHEFKTPLSIIKGYIETILKADDIPKDNREKFLNKILRNTDRLNNLIQDLITLNKLDESKDYFRKENVNISHVVDNCLDILFVKAEAKQIELLNEIKPDRIEVTGNLELLETIFFNLIDNGITYTEEAGSVIISYEGNGNTHTFTVTDTGIGIPVEFKDRIFERFYRVDEGRSRKSGGTGLGLSIVKHAVILHNGHIVCENNPTGRGSQFRVQFPVISNSEDD